jgi:hypothetical protein
VPVGSAGEKSGGAQEVPYGPFARTQSERRRRLGLAGGVRLLGSFGLDPTRRAGARGGARIGRASYLRILMITGGSSMLSCVEGVAMILKVPLQFGQCSMSMSKTRLSSRGAPAHARGARPALARDRMRARLLALPD